MKRRPLVRFIAAALAVFVLAAGGMLSVQQLRATAAPIPTVRVERGSVELEVHSRGELRTPRASTLMGPPVSGTLQIITLATTGTRVEAGDIVVEFDPSEQEYNLEQARYQLQQAEQEIVKMKLEADVQAAQDKVALLRARFDVRRAELEVGRNELVSQIEAAKNLLNLEEARRRLAQLEDDVKSRSASNEAAMRVVNEKRNEAQIAIRQAQASIDSMILRAPIAGLVNVLENRDAAGGFFFSGMVLPEYRSGDLVLPGRAILEVLGVDDMEISARLDENDRANVNPGQEVEVRVDAHPGRVFAGRVKTVATLAARQPWGAEAQRKFDATFELEARDERLRTGQTAQVTVRGKQLADVLSLPRQCLFEKDGKQVVYVRTGTGFEPREVKLTYRSESRIVVEELPEGTEVALVNPELQPKSQKQNGGAALEVGR